MRIAVLTLVSGIVFSGAALFIDRQPEGWRPWYRDYQLECAARVLKDGGKLWCPRMPRTVAQCLGY